MALTALLAVRGAVPRGRGRRPRLPTLARALLPRRVVRSRLGQLDIAGFLFNRLFAGSALGWALVSGEWWAAWAERCASLLPVLAVHLPTWPAAVLMTGALFVAYEGAYWLNHWLSHRVGWLWEFHKVHHTAESLSLLTNFRVHPVDSSIFYNMAAAIIGVTAGLLRHLIGPATAELTRVISAVISAARLRCSTSLPARCWCPSPRGRLCGSVSTDWPMIPTASRRDAAALRRCRARMYCRAGLISCRRGRQG